MAHVVDLSHSISDGLVTYPGLPGPTISDFLSREESRTRYAAGTEFHIGQITMVANTGTYLDTPFHRFPDGWDLAGLALEAVCDLPVVVVRVEPGVASIEGDRVTGRELSGFAVLFNTGWDRHWATPRYGDPDHPFLTTEAAAALIDDGVALVGIDSVNVDDTRTGERPVHTALLAAGIPIVEHLTNLDAVTPAARFFAVPPKVEGLGTFPVRAFALA